MSKSFALIKFIKLLLSSMAIFVKCLSFTFGTNDWLAVNEWMNEWMTGWLVAAGDGLNCQTNGRMTIISLIRISCRLSTSGMAHKNKSHHINFRTEEQQQRSVYNFTQQHLTLGKVFGRLLVWQKNSPNEKSRTTRHTQIELSPSLIYFFLLICFSWAILLFYYLQLAYCEQLP